MPLDGHSYLVAQGWSGKGNGLRKGAIAKPITANQKKTLSGLGKDRDEAFPFWDHLFSAASQAITIKIDDSDASDSDEVTPNVAPVLRRTTTGILSNRRPVDVTPASTSGTSTPELRFSEVPRLGLIATAKREAAKHSLYSRFYRGAVLAPEIDLKPFVSTTPSFTPSFTPLPCGTLSGTFKSNEEVKVEQVDVGEKREKKRKAEKLEKEDVNRAETRDERRERKRRKKEAKEMKLKLQERKSREVRSKDKSEKNRKEKRTVSASAGDDLSANLSPSGTNAEDRKRNKKERRRQKKEEKEAKQRSESEQPSVTEVSLKPKKRIPVWS